MKRGRGLKRAAGPAEVLLKRETWPLMTIRKERWGVRLSEEVGEVIRETWKISEEFATVLEEFESAVSYFCRYLEDNSIYFERDAHDSVPFSNVLWTDVVKILRLVLLPCGLKRACKHMAKAPLCPYGKTL